MKSYKKQRPPHILIVGATHGHEYLGVRIIEELQKLHICDSVLDMEIGNLRAYKQNIAFTESDLNRVFPGKCDGNYEERRAHKLSKKIKKADIVIDIHATDTIKKQDEAMLIVTKLDNAIKKIIDIINPPNVIIMKYKSDKALISNAKIGIAFEYGANNDEAVFRSVLYSVCAILCAYSILDHNPYTNTYKSRKTDIYNIYDVYTKPEKKCILEKVIRNFHLVKRGDKIAECGSVSYYTDEAFVPILFGENRYTDIFGFKGRVVE